MTWPWAQLSLVDRFWLLTNGVHPVTRPTSIESATQGSATWHRLEETAHYQNATSG